MKALFALILLPLPLMAQEVDCANAITQADMNTCAARDLTEADSALNLAFGAAVKRMKAVDAGLPQDRRGAEDALRRAQRAWITLRDAGCEAAAWSYDGGSMQGMVLVSCKAEATRARNAELDRTGSL